MQSDTTNLTNFRCTQNSYTRRIKPKMNMITITKNGHSKRDDHYQTVYTNKAISITMCIDSYHMDLSIRTYTDQHGKFIVSQVSHFAGGNGFCLANIDYVTERNSGSRKSSTSEWKCEWVSTTTGQAEQKRVTGRLKSNYKDSYRNKFCLNLLCY